MKDSATWQKSSFSELITRVRWIEIGRIVLVGLLTFLYWRQVLPLQVLLVAVAIKAPDRGPRRSRCPSRFVCSVCAPLRTAPQHRVKTGYSLSPERGAWKRNVLCFQFTVVFPSWTSRVRTPSPAPSFQ